MRQSRDTMHIRDRDVVATWQVRFVVIFSEDEAAIGCIQRGDARLCVSRPVKRKAGFEKEEWSWIGIVQG